MIGEGEEEDMINEEEIDDREMVHTSLMIRLLVCHCVTRLYIYGSIIMSYSVTRIILSIRKDNQINQVLQRGFADDRYNVH